MDLVSSLSSYDTFELEVSAATQARIERDTAFFAEELQNISLQSEFSDEVWFDTWNDLEISDKDLADQVALARHLKRQDA